MFRRTASHSRNVAILFDVHSSGVGGGIVRLDESAPELYWYSRTALPLQHELDYTRFIRSMFTSFLEVGMQLVSDGIPTAIRAHNVVLHHMPVYVVFSAPWYFGAVKQLRITQDQGFIVTPALLSDQLAVAKDELLASEEAQSYQAVVRSIDVLDAELLDLRLEGYATTHYNQKRVHEVTGTAYFSITSPQILDKSKEVLAKVIPNAHVLYTTSSRVLSRAAQVRLPHATRVCLVEVTGEVSTVSLFADRVLVHTSTFPYGVNHLIRAVAEGESDIKHARDILTVLAPKLSTKSGFPATLLKALREWQQAYQECVTTLSRGVTPPRNALLVADSFSAPWFLSLLGEHWLQSGVRVELNQRAVHFVGQDNVGQQNVDMRLQVLALGLSTSKNSMLHR